MRCGKSSAHDHDLIEDIRKAFENVPYPGDQRVVEGYLHPDEEHSLAFFRGMDWRRLCVSDLAEHWLFLGLMTPEAFRFFLPAYLIAMLQGHAEMEAAAATVISCLTIAASEHDRGISLHSELLEERMGILTPSQRAAVRAFLEYTIEENADDPPYHILPLAFDRHWDLRVASEKLAKLREAKQRVNDAVVEAMKDESPDVREGAAIALGIHGEDSRAVHLLIEALKDEDARVRAAAAAALEDLGDARAAVPLIGALKDEAPSVRANAALAFCEMRVVRALDPLIQALHDTNAHVRGFAARALGLLGDNQAVGPLIDALKDTDVWVRQSVARALGRLGDCRAAQRLEEIAENDVSPAREAAREALARLGWVRPPTDGA